jgi:hypothetical protein
MTPPLAASRMAYHPSSRAMILLAWEGEAAKTWAFRNHAWTELIPVSPGVPARFPLSMALDEATGHVILLDFFGSLWRFDGVAWVRLPAARSAPDARRFQMMTYDSARKVVVMFGGLSHDAQIHYDDTWTWDGQDWTQRG